jgi:hypothetical protein
MWRSSYLNGILLLRLPRGHLLGLWNVWKSKLIIIQHRSHSIIHLSKIYQENKNSILNELAKFDNKIELFRKNGYLIKQELQKLLMQVGQKKNFIEEYFITLI